MAQSRQGRSLRSHLNSLTRIGRRTFLLLLLLPVLIPALRGQGGGEAGELYLVQLREPAAAERLAAVRPAALQAGERISEDPRVDGFRQEVREGQRRFLSRVSGSTLREELESCTYLINGVFVRASANAIRSLRQDPEVERVYRSAPRYPVLDAAAEMVNAPQAWQILGGIDKAGDGIRIGIIDSGINQNHAMFRPDGMTMPRGYPLGNSTFTNSKVIVARSFWEWFPSPPTQPSDRTPEDQQGHGTRVASIAAGRVTQAPLATIQGIAPRAYLGNYKVFGRGANSTTTSLAIVKAIDQAAADGMHVINLSLGGERVDPEGDPEHEAITNAVKLGIVVVVAAGNEGPDAGTVTSPGTSLDAITVGAVSNQRVFGPALAISGSVPVPDSLKSVPYTAGQGVTIPSALGPFPVASLTPLDPQELACSPLPASSLRGRIALVKRGTCFFQVKAANVFAAGAEAMIVYNNEASGTLVMAFENAPAKPAVMIELADGEALRNLVNSSPSQAVLATLGSDSQLAPFEVPGGELASFSGRGPGFDGEIKPDLVAVGTRLYTASEVTGQFALDASGTSFSSPMVAGAAALIRQLHPGWPAAAVKSALVNTAVKTPTVSGSTPNVMQIGNGLLDLGRAAQTTTVLAPVSLSFDTSVSSPSTRQLAVTLTNLWSGERRYTLAYQPSVQNPSVQVAVSPSTITVPAGQSTPVTVTATYKTPLLGGIFEGHLVITDAQGSPELTAPVRGALLLENPEITLLVSQQAAGAFTTLDAALQEAGPGNVIEFADSAVYSTRSVIEVNGDGLPLNGLTIRAREGERPILDGAGLDNELAVLTIRNTERVTIEGLEIRGGEIGVSFETSTGTVKDCVIEGAASTAFGYGVEAWLDSQIHVYGNTIRDSAGAAVSTFLSGALIQGNQIGDPDPALAINGSGIDVFSGDDSGIFDNRIIGGNTTAEQQGISFYGSSGIARGNEITGFVGTDGDGIRLNDSSLDLYDNRLSGNEQAGLALIDASEARSEGNDYSANGFAGILLQGESTLTGRRESVTENENGIVATKASLQLSDSLVAFSTGNGIRGIDSSLDVVNTTAFGNGGYGVSSVSARSNRLVNSIAASNGDGDLSGISAGAASHNLIGDGEFAGSNGNRGGNPGLADPQGGNFAPGPGSPAVDAGNNEQAGAAGTDLLGHQRAVDGDSNGSAVVDMGAVEANASHAPPLVLPLPNPAPDEFVGLALTSSRTIFSEGAGEPAHVQVNAYNTGGGAPYGGQPLAVDPLGQKARLVSQVIANPRSGWLEVLADGPGLTGFTLTGDYSLTRLDGMALADRPATRSVLTEVRTTGPAETTFYLVNPHSSAVNATVRWVRNGSVQQKSAQVPPRGSFSASVETFFGPGDGGYLAVDSPAGLPLYSFEFFGTPDALGALAGQPAEAASNLLYGAQLAASPGIQTLINVVNLSDQTASVTFDVFRESGEKVGNISKSVSLAPGAQFRQDAGQFLELEDFVGWLRVGTLSAGLVGSVSFESPDGSILAGLPLQAEGARESILGHVAQSEQVFTGITVLNPDSLPALFSIEVFDGEGNLVGTALRQLGEKEKQARLLPEWIPGLTNQVEGFIRIRSNRPVIAFELFGSGAGAYLAAVPQQVRIP